MSSRLGTPVTLLFMRIGFWNPCECDLKKMEATGEDDEGFQPEPEIIMIQDVSPDLEPEQSPLEINSEVLENSNEIDF